MVRITYYAIADDLSSPEEPVGVLRRIEHDGGERDEQFGHDLAWTCRPLPGSRGRHGAGSECYRISAGEAYRIVERIRRVVTGGTAPAEHTAATSTSSLMPVRLDP